MNLRMRNLPATLRALAIASVCCEGSAIAAADARNAPFVLIVPYFTVVGDIRASNSVSVYKIDAATGAPRLAAGSPFAVGRDPSDEALAPGGRFAYVINKGSNSVSAFEVGAATGALRPVAGSPFTVDYSASGPNGIVVDPTGKYAYVVSDAGVSAFSVNATTGALVRVPGSPFAKGTSDGFGTTAIAVDPRGKFAYVLDYFNNTVSAYTIDAAGALKLKGSPLAAGQNSNDPGSFNSVRVAPNGRFLYVTGTCCINVYAIDATTGALAPPAHLSLGLLGEGTLTGFRIDPTGKFAYVADDGSRVYTYTINAATGALKAAAGRKFALRTGTGAYTGPYSVTIDPKGTFAYVFDSGSRVARPTISVYRIDPSAGELTPAPRSPYAVATNGTDPIERWFNAGRCAAFDGTLAAETAPLAERDSEGVIFDRFTAKTRGYFYDPKSRSALHYPNTDSGGTFTLRVSGPPPAGVAQHDLSKLRTASGIELGSSAATVVSLLGKPKIINACGLQRYLYLRNREGEPTSLEFTIGNGRVTEISEDFGG
jgi:6-phosphogluconolactonase